uniref:Uncharacterized protein n=1 Tax=Aegilops tauschii subsp. strangulata TaxID=200361 RepID=A0A453DF76_AEGTS
SSTTGRTHAPSAPPPLLLELQETRRVEAPVVYIFPALMIPSPSQLPLELQASQTSSSKPRRNQKTAAPPDHHHYHTTRRKLPCRSSRPPPLPYHGGICLLEYGGAFGNRIEGPRHGRRVAWRSLGGGGASTAARSEDH